jgi:very-short-patch-repair endonuclease
MTLVTCLNCNKLFDKLPYEIKTSATNFCSRDCHATYRKRNIEKNTVSCKNCNKAFYKLPVEQKKTPSHFCSRSCAATFNNKNKTTGTRVSKLEQFIQQKLVLDYNYEFHFNRKDTIKSELDIYIPEIKLAIEINGIFHYKPIYGEEKLLKIQSNDKQKLQACLEHKIKVYVINTSWLSYNKLENFEKVYSVIRLLINSKS